MSPRRERVGRGRQEHQDSLADQSADPSPQVEAPSFPDVPGSDSAIDNASVLAYNALRDPALLEQNPLVASSLLADDQQQLSYLLRSEMLQQQLGAQQLLQQRQQLALVHPSLSLGALEATSLHPLLQPTLPYAAAVLPQLQSLPLLARQPAAILPQVALPPTALLPEVALPAVGLLPEVAALPASTFNSQQAASGWGMSAAAELALQQQSAAAAARETGEPSVLAHGEAPERGTLPPRGYKREAWDVMYERLIEYKNRHGDCAVPQDYKDIPKLGNWVQKQRTLKKADRLSPTRVERLDAIGFIWRVQESWDFMYERLKEYKLQHGDCDVPKHYAENPKLGKWVRVQRMRRKILSDDRLERLRSIGFDDF